LSDIGNVQHSAALAAFRGCYDLLDRRDFSFLASAITVASDGERDPARPYNDNFMVAALSFHVDGLGRAISSWASPKKV